MYLIIRYFYKKNDCKIKAPVLLLTLGVFCAVNIIYNLFVMFPDYYMDTYTGVYRYGTFRGNLFAYSDEFRYRDEILFPILREREVFLDSSVAADVYVRFFSMFDRSKSVNRIDIGKDRDSIINGDHDYITDFNMIDLMDYATDSVPEDLLEKLEKDILPVIHIDLSSLKGKKSIVVAVTEDYDLYIKGWE